MRFSSIASFLVAFTMGASGHPIESRESNQALSTPYRLFRGNGTVQQGWPSANEWVSFDTMWGVNQNLMRQSCGQYGQAPNSEKELQDMRNSLLSVSDSSGVDARFILATILQESGGCVRAPTSYYGVANPGLMQTHNGMGSCHGTTPCPGESIYTMVNDGAAGTYGGYNAAAGGPGDGLRQCLDKARGTGAGDQATATYRAARIYNTGSYHQAQFPDLSLPEVATKCYASDIANRLVGFSELATACRLDGW